MGCPAIFNSMQWSIGLFHFKYAFSFSARVTAMSGITAFTEQFSLLLVSCDDKMIYLNHNLIFAML
jgi:hypothetical protein